MLLTGLFSLTFSAPFCYDPQAYLPRNGGTTHSGLEPTNWQLRHCFTGLPIGWSAGDTEIPSSQAKKEFFLSSYYSL